MKKRNTLRIAEFEEEYKPNNSIWNEDADNIDAIKRIIFNELTEADKNIILYYAHHGTQQKTAEALGVSVATLNIYLSKLRQQIKTKIRERNDSIKNHRNHRSNNRNSIFPHHRHI